MRIIVCLKQVLHPFEAESLGKGEEPSHIYMVNPHDRIAVEEALKTRVAAKGSEVVAITAGPERAKQALQWALARGCDNAVHLNDDALASSDGSTTALALSKAIYKLGFTIIFCGSESLDTGAAQVPTSLAQLLGIPVVTRVIKLENISKQKVRAWRRLEGGIRQIVECSLPAVLSIDPFAAEPQYVSVFTFKQFADRRVQEFKLDDIDLRQTDIGQDGSLVQVIGLGPPKPRSKPVHMPDNSSSVSQRLSNLLFGALSDRRQKELMQGTPEYLASRILKYLIEEGILPKEY